MVMSIGRCCVMKLMIPVMSFGSASINFGSARMMPSAKPVTIENAAASTLSILLSKVSQINSTASMIAGISVGSASPIP